MNGKPKKIVCFDNYPEAKLALGKVTFPAIIKPYGCDNPDFFFHADAYGKAVDVLYDAFEKSISGWVAIESY